MTHFHHCDCLLIEWEHIMPKSIKVVNDTQSATSIDHGQAIAIRSGGGAGSGDGKKLEKRRAVVRASHDLKTGRRRMAITFATKSASKKKSSSLRGRGNGKDGGDGSITKKRRRFRPGTVALREIRDIQGGKHKTTNCIRKLPMYNLVRETLQGVCDYKITAGAVAALQQASEFEIVKQFEAAQILAIHSKRETVQPEDLVAANRVRTIHPGKSHMPFDETKIYVFRGDGPKKRGGAGQPNIKLVKRDRNNIRKTRKIINTSKILNTPKIQQNPTVPLLPGVTGNIRFTVLPPDNTQIDTVSNHCNDDAVENVDVEKQEKNEKDNEEEKEEEEDEISLSLSLSSLSSTSTEEDGDDETEGTAVATTDNKTTILPEKDDEMDDSNVLGSLNEEDDDEEENINDL